MKTAMILTLLVVGTMLLTGCLAQDNPLSGTSREEGEIPAGFWLGLWHGIISPVTFIVSLFSDRFHFYEVFNNGGWYNFGFVLGAGIILGSGGRASS